MTTRSDPSSVRMIAPAHMAIVMLNHDPKRQVAINSDRVAQGSAPAGTLEIAPRQSDFFSRWSIAKRSLLVMLDSARLERLAGDEFDRLDFEIYSPAFGFVDDRLHEVAKHMQSELESYGLRSPETLDSLITVFSVYLLRAHSSIRARSKTYPGGLRSSDWRRVRDFIDANLDQHLSLECLAAVAGLSPSHFARAFKHTASQSPHHYVLELRLSRARRLIRETDRTFADIAKACGFSSNSRMTAIMQRTWRMTPSKCRQER